MITTQPALFDGKWLHKIITAVPALFFKVFSSNRRLLVALFCWTVLSLGEGETFSIPEWKLKGFYSCPRRAGFSHHLWCLWELEPPRAGMSLLGSAQSYWPCFSYGSSALLPGSFGKFSAQFNPFNWSMTCVALGKRGAKWGQSLWCCHLLLYLVKAPWGISCLEKRAGGRRCTKTNSAFQEMRAMAMLGRSYNNYLLCGSFSGCLSTKFLLETP